MEASNMSNAEWQNTVTSEKRMQLVNNLIQAMSTLQNTSTAHEQDLFNQASQLESQIYEKANSRANYYNLIAQQIYKIGENGQTQLVTELEDLLSNLNLNEITFDDEENNHGLPVCSGALQDSEQENKITFYHMKVWYMLLHAFECMVTETQCVLPNCSKFRNVLTHLMTCLETENCNEYFCNSSRILISHWTHCEQKENCLLCKKVNELKKPAITTINKEWHQSCTLDLREHLITKLTMAMYSFPPSVVVAYMRKLEKETYEVANSRSEYYHLLASHIYEFQKKYNMNISNT